MLSLFFLLSLTFHKAYCQDTTAITPIIMTDSIAVENNKTNKKPKPKTALYLSLALPGAGQAYNKRWWKLPLVYGAIGGVIYAIDYNTRNYNQFKDALNLKRQDMPHAFTGTFLDNERALLVRRNYFDKNRQLSYIGLVAVYGLQAIEAFVDAHLKNFDIDEDISIRIKPTIDTFDPTGEPVLGVGVSIPLYGR